MLVTRHVDGDVFYQAEIVELSGIYLWAISLGTAAQSMSFTGQSHNPLHALSQMRNTLLASNDVANDILLDVKSAIDTLIDDQNFGCGNSSPTNN
jgi:hypothetical protein